MPNYKLSTTLTAASSQAWVMHCEENLENLAQAAFKAVLKYNHNHLDYWESKMDNLSEPSLYTMELLGFPACFQNILLTQQVS